MKIGALMVAILATWLNVAAASEQAPSPTVPRLEGTSRYLPGDVVDLILAGSGSSGSRSSGGSSGGSNGSIEAPNPDLDELNGEEFEPPGDEDEED